jgi:hypothetical protein
MQRRFIAGLALVLMTPARAADQLEAILQRVSEEAEVFQAMALSVVGRETLQQRARQKRSRFRLRVGDDAYNPPPVKFQNREIISEFGFGALADSPDSLMELREIVSVDGRQVAGRHKARETLTLGVRSDDKAKKRMLRRFERHGLRGAATDFSQLILLFRRGNLGRYEFQTLRSDRSGADEVWVIGFRQKEGSESFTIFQGREAVHAVPEGEIWARKPDYVPLRITITTHHEEENGKHTARHTGTVDYRPSSYGVLLPASVRYEKYIDDELFVDSLASYGDFKMFAVETQIKFTPEDVPLEAPATGPPPQP